jgi:hypothetical protein
MVLAREAYITMLLIENRNPFQGHSVGIWATSIGCKCRKEHGGENVTALFVDVDIIQATA